MYNGIISTVLGSSVGALLVFRPGVNTGWEESTPVVLEPVGGPVSYLGNYDGVRGRE